MIRERISILVEEALQTLGISPEVVHIERTADRTHGDYATNVALVYAKKDGVSPRDLAGKLVIELLKVPSEEISKIEIAGPGFINFFLTDTALEDILAQGTTVEKVRADETINLEFISTNPTGELHLGHGRGAFFGDTLARVLVLVGAKVTREFYINDSRESKQIKELGTTALGTGTQYKTPALEELMRGMDFSGLSEIDAGFNLASMIHKENRLFIESGLGINFDAWYSEDSELRASGAPVAMLNLLKERGVTYEKEGALWLTTSQYGDDEDRVIVRSDGTMPYFINDIAYHQKKFDRGFQTVLDVWGADHHGHIKRMQAVGRLLGWPADTRTALPQPTVFIAQMVSLKEDGIAKKMSKRAGTVILLRDLVEEFGIDVVRWFFNEKSLGTQMAFDMALAREQSERNPVYYVQYAHARLASIIEKCRGFSAQEDRLFSELMEIPSCRALVSTISEFPEVVVDTARDYHVHRLTIYATALAGAVNAFYRDVRVIEGDNYHPVALMLAVRAKETLAQTLSLLGIRAPESM